MEIFGDFGVGGVDFLLEFVGFLFESFGCLATIFLALVADFVGDGENEAVIGVDVFVGEDVLGEADDFTAGDAFAVALVGEGGPVITSGDDDAATAEGRLGDFLPEFDAGGGKK